jgi:hypothetical protein
MSWVRLEDTFYDHPKVLAAGNAAVGLHILSICYSSAKLTDGHITPRIVRFLGGTPKLAARLVSCRLWEVEEDGWLIHDFLDYNPSRETIEAHRQAVSEQRAKAGRLGGIASAITKQRASKPKANGQPHPVPTRPDPNQGSTEAERVVSRKTAAVHP